MLPESKITVLDRIYEAVVLKCDKCKGERYECECRDEFKLLKYMFVTANVPFKYLFMELKDIIDEGLLQIKYLVEHFIKDFDENFRRGRCFLFYSKNKGKGSGKTSLGIILLKAAIKLGYSGYFVTMRECGTLFSSTFNDKEKGSYKEALLRDKLETVDVLVVDDMDKAPEFVHKFLYSIIHERCNQLKVTILTSNFDASVEAAGKTALGNKLFLYIKDHMEFLEFSNGSFDPTEHKNRKGVKINKNAKPGK